MLGCRVLPGGQGGDYSFVYEGGETLAVEEVLGNLLQVLGSEDVDVAHDVAEVALSAAVQIVLGKVEGELLAAVAGDGQLSL